MRRAPLSAALIAPCALLAPTHAQCDPHWLPGLGLGGTNGAVRAALAWDPDGPDGPLPEWTVIAGDFTIAGNASVGRLAAWDGALWHDLGGGVSGGSGTVRINALAVWNGDLIAAGVFFAAGGVPAANIARYDGDTGLWSTFGPGLANSGINALAVHDGDLYAGGQLLLPGNVSIARWNGAHWIGDTVGGQVVALVPHAGDLYAGGNFTSLNGDPTAYIARRDAAETWQPVGSGLGSQVLALAVVGDRLAASGSPSLLSGSPLALWDGQSWTAVTGLLNVQHVAELGAFGGDLFVAGIFTIPGAVPARHLARWSPAAGGTWHPLSATSPLGTIYCFAPVGGSMLAGGELERIGGVTVSNVALWDTQAWAPIAPGIRISFSDFSPAALAEHEGELYIGGRFTAVGPGTTISGVARWDGHSLDAYPPRVGGTVAALVSYNGDLIAGGFFDSPGGVPAQNIARFDGEVWHPMGDGLSGNPGVLALAVYQDELIAAGIAGAGVATVPYLARWTGSAWAPFAGGVNYTVTTLLVDGDTLYAGGGFTVIGGLPAARVARFDGTQWYALGTGLNSTVQALTIHNGDLIAGGGFSGYLRRWDGAAWGLIEGGPTGPVASLGVYDGDLFVAGAFIAAGQVAANRIARWTGAQWLPLDEGLDNTGQKLATFGPELIISGPFTTAGGLVSRGVARYTATGAPAIALQPDRAATSIGGSATFTVAVSSGYEDVTYQWRRAGIPLTDGTNPSGSVVTGAATPTLTITAVTTSDAALYSCAVASPCGASISRPAVLAVDGAPCPSDWNSDGQLNSLDISAYLNDWLTGSAAADLNNDSVVDSIDLSAFLTAWLAGC